MYEQVEKPKENKSRAVANSVSQNKSNLKQGFKFADNRQKAAGSVVVQPSHNRTTQHTATPQIIQMVRSKQQKDFVEDLKQLKEKVSRLAASLRGTSEWNVFQAYQRRINELYTWAMGFKLTWNPQGRVEAPNIVQANRYEKGYKHWALRAQQAIADKAEAKVRKEAEQAKKAEAEGVEGKELDTTELPPSASTHDDRDSKKDKTPETKAPIANSSYKDKEELGERAPTVEASIEKGDFFITGITASAGVQKGADEGIVESFEAAINSGKVKWSSFRGNTHNIVDDPLNSSKTFKAHMADGKCIKLYLDPSNAGGSKLRAKYKLNGTTLAYIGREDH